MKNDKVKWLTKVGMLSAIAWVLMLLEFPVAFFFPPWLQMDLSDLPALLAGFSLGPVAGVCVELVKNLLHMLTKGLSFGGAGQLANFLVGIAFVWPAAMIYKKHKTLKRAIIGMATGALCMSVVGMLANYYILIPVAFPGNALSGMSTAAVPIAGALGAGQMGFLGAYVIFGVLPFNLIKAVLVSLLTGVLYKRLSGILHR